MLIRLVRERLAPYKLSLTLIVLLQFTGTIATLYLPSLNADIIDRGVAAATPATSCASAASCSRVTLLQIVCSVAAVYFGARTAMGFGRDVRAAIFHRVGSFSPREVRHFGAPSLITRTTNDVQQVQMLVLMACTMMVAGADHDGRRHRSWRCARTSASSWLLAVSRPGAAARGRR